MIVGCQALNLSSNLGNRSRVITLSQCTDEMMKNSMAVVGPDVRMVVDEAHRFGGGDALRVRMRRVIGTLNLTDSCSRTLASFGRCDLDAGTVQAGGQQYRNR